MFDIIVQLYTRLAQSHWILGIHNTCAASGCLSFPDASWEKVDNFVIVVIGLTRKQWDFILRTTQMKEFMWSIKGYDSVIVHSHVCICMKPILHVYKRNTIGNICYRVICITRGFSILTFSHGALGKYHLSEATVGSARIANTENWILLHWLHFFLPYPSIMLFLALLF